MSPPRARRIDELDVLRGFALFGILVVNALLMAGPYTVLGGGPGASGADRIAAWAVTALVTAKFYVLFSFLFGYGFALQARSARRAGAAFAPRHLRRTAGLFVLGAAHAALLYPGDVLTTYAVLALVLYGLSGLGVRALLRVAAALLLLLAALLLGYGLLTVALTEPVPDASYTPGDAARAAAYRGDAASVLHTHLRDLPAVLGTNLLYAPAMLAAFLGGLAAAKSRLAERRGQDRAWLRRTALRRLPLGLGGGAVAACCASGPLDGRWFLVGQAVTVLTAPALATSYACGLLLLLTGRAGARVPAAAGVLAAAGRMALTHYLTQSLVLACVFSGYGLGLYDRAGTVAVLADCVLLYAAQLWLGARLSARTRYGPAEWVLRAVTLGRRPGGPPRPVTKPAWTAAPLASRSDPRRSAEPGDGVPPAP
ncbi:hypothetical protein A4E84_32155 [Streptomyces qaidamensis]|uniref:DUF418 domain-containing protein n=1 Tax=Streptomyces qaidamensis TaxID=1783515 RepID=A0A143C8I8_9ACTN|nr:DUF418 domain-containing protein [Streptomyces qaidamensis]AMW13756.1 hypothetical protein A4E84_32155 [Streptomyces qaidamensis]